MNQEYFEYFNGAGGGEVELEFYDSVNKNFVEEGHVKVEMR